MWGLETIISMNAAPPARQYIYDLGNGKFALGNLGKKATYVVRRVANKVDALGRGLPTYKGVQARRPTIPTYARRIRRDQAGRLLRKALGV